jgi:hypothetical protein
MTRNYRRDSGPLEDIGRVVGAGYGGYKGYKKGNNMSKDSDNHPTLNKYPKTTKVATTLVGATAGEIVGGLVGRILDNIIKK